MKASNIIKLTDSLGKQQFGELRQFILENRLEIPQNVRNFLNAVGTISISENGKLHHGTDKDQLIQISHRHKPLSAHKQMSVSDPEIRLQTNHLR